MTTLVSIECNEHMGRDKSVRQPWSDVRICFITEPGAETSEFEPTLISRSCLERDLRQARELEVKDPKPKRSERTAKLQEIVETLNNGVTCFVHSRSPDDRIPEIYTQHDYIDQEEAERMLAHFLSSTGLKEIGFQWVWPDVVCSVG